MANKLDMDLKGKYVVLESGDRGFKGNDIATIRCVVCNRVI